MLLTEGENTAEGFESRGELDYQFLFEQVEVGMPISIQLKK